MSPSCPFLSLLSFPSFFLFFSPVTGSGSLVSLLVLALVLYAVLFLGFLLPRCSFPDLCLALGLPQILFVARHRRIGITRLYKCFAMLLLRNRELGEFGKRGGRFYANFFVFAVLRFSYFELFFLSIEIWCWMFNQLWYPCLGVRWHFKNYLLKCFLQLRKVILEDVRRRNHITFRYSEWMEIETILSISQAFRSQNSSTELLLYIFSLKKSQFSRELKIQVGFCVLNPHFNSRNLLIEFHSS